MNTRMALVIMAAGIGSRFGEGIKQLERVGPNGEIIMDYSIHDAIEAGVSKIVFVIRKNMEQAFHAAIGERIKQECGRLGVEVCYAYQELDMLPEGYVVPTERTKPWGTGHAILCCKGKIDEPFVVINADDYYGKKGFGRIFNFMKDSVPEQPGRFCMAGFQLKNTLSDHGGVTRGVCEMNEVGELTKVTETFGIKKTESGAESNGHALNVNVPVSMNMWGLTPSFLNELERGFTQFLSSLGDNEQKAEYLLPTIIDGMVQNGSATVQVLETDDKWFGMTYKQDQPIVEDAFRRMAEAGMYRQELFSDLNHVNMKDE